MVIRPVLLLHFNPRSPCGERPEAVSSNTGSIANFNPRSPCGERPEVVPPEAAAEEISIHAPRVGSDAQKAGLAHFGRDFNPRSPCGERQQQD